GQEEEEDSGCSPKAVSPRLEIGTPNPSPPRNPFNPRPAAAPTPPLRLPHSDSQSEHGISQSPPKSILSSIQETEHEDSIGDGAVEEEEEKAKTCPSSRGGIKLKRGGEERQNVSASAGRGTSAFFFCYIAHELGLSLSTALPSHLTPPSN
ncbi:hypothetical protein BHM03_00007447, partial [Ensete ventricosum]